MTEAHRQLALRALQAGFLDAQLVSQARWTIGDRYEVLGTIGQGGAGIVFHVRDTRLGREAALKLLDVAAHPDPARFLQEVQLLARLEHPGVIAITDTGLHAGAPYYVMERAAGTLAEADLPLEDWLRLFARVARTCGVIHAQGIVHRDLKPENILLVKGEPRLADFGVAKQLGPDLVSVGRGLTRKGALVGTAASLSPEQLGDGAVTPATDVHALGVMLFQRVCGAPPFAADQDLLTLSASILAETRPSPLEHAPGLPRGLVRIVERALARRPADRYADGHELADALDAWLAPVQPWRDPRTLGAAAAVLLVGIGALVWAARGATPPDPAPGAAVSSEAPHPLDAPPAPEMTPRPALAGTPSPSARLTPQELASAAASLTPGSDPRPLLERLRRELAASLEDDVPRLLFDVRPEWRAPLQALRGALRGQTSPGARCLDQAASLLEDRYVLAPGRRVESISARVAQLDELTDDVAASGFAGEVLTLRALLLLGRIRLLREVRSDVVDQEALIARHELDLWATLERLDALPPTDPALSERAALLALHRRLVRR